MFEQICGRMKGYTCIPRNTKELSITISVIAICHNLDLYYTKNIHLNNYNSTNIVYLY